jgi:hypothetical protein
MAVTAVPPQCQACYACAVLKLLLMSMLLATFLVPAVAASGRKPLRALRIMLVFILIAELGYAFFLRFIYGRML